MKQILSLLLILALVLSFGACAKQPKMTATPEEGQMRAICELAVMDCYYHNVAKYKQEDAESFLWWKWDKHFWVEYSGMVRVGIDVSQVKIQIDDDHVSITLPEAQVLNATVDELTEDSYIVADGSADSSAADGVEAMKVAQEHMKETASADKALLSNARERARTLLEQYIKNIGDAVGKTYTIHWVYLDAEGDTQPAPTDPSATE